MTKRAEYVSLHILLTYIEYTGDVSSVTYHSVRTALNAWSNNMIFVLYFFEYFIRC